MKILFSTARKVVIICRAHTAGNESNQSVYTNYNFSFCLPTFSAKKQKKKHDRSFLITNVTSSEGWKFAETVLVT